ncbi:MAG: hypothetical protein RMZ41_019250 [Nostoc sp. DedVER02]|uniref:hypothetical protein n=1 Tax=unclassified Nostoc TaxID=2593658 RepID=UPI002AD4146F|nr:MULTISPECIES: hypothetical protein [unclassified Nostoc]MDZ7988942.1 hypothetical protein [Nostoc sp. DedVER02]MDZ8114736.1 hypothetical protein [Nostoc sp. DedVER01b]
MYATECKAIADSDEVFYAELKKLQDKRAKTKTERHQERKAELPRRYEIDVTPDLVLRDDDGWYPQFICIRYFVKWYDTTSLSTSHNSDSVSSSNNIELTTLVTDTR